MSISSMEVQEAILEEALERLIAQRDPQTMKIGCEEGWSVFVLGMQPVSLRSVRISSLPGDGRSRLTLTARERMHLRGVTAVSPAGRVFPLDFGPEGRWVEVGCGVHIPCPSPKLAHLR